MTNHLQPWTRIAWKRIAKRSCLVGIAILVLAGLCLSQSATTSSPSDWPQFHNENMQRWNTYETVLNVTNVGSLVRMWTFGTGAIVRSSPAVVNGVVYIGSEDGNVYALNAATGAKLWSYATGDWVDSSPAVANGVVYIGSRNYKFYALNTTTGALLWSYQATIGGDTQTGQLSSPAIANGVVYFGSGNGTVYALNASTGAKLWSYQTGAWIESKPAVANGVVYVGSEDNNLYALNASTGAKLWSYAAGGFVDSSPAVVNGVVYFGSRDEYVHALNASTGAQLWSFFAGNWAQSSPSVANGVVYIGAGWQIFALDAATGGQLWQYKTDSWTISAPAVANGVVYIGSDDYKVYAFNATTGAKLWSYETSGGVESSPVIVDGVVYVGSGCCSSLLGHNIYAFGLLPITLSPSSLNFGSQLLNTTSQPKTVTLTNTSDAAVDISSIVASGNFSQTNNCGSSVLAGASCAMAVTFTPTSTSTSAETGTLTVTDDASGSPQTVKLSGAGTVVTVSVKSLNFGDQPVGTTSPARTITFTNQSTSRVVSIPAITISGLNSPAFAQTNNCGTSLAEGASCTISVTFTPHSKGSKTATLNLWDNGGSGSPKVALTGNGT